MIQLADFIFREKCRSESLQKSYQEPTQVGRSRRPRRARERGLRNSANKLGVRSQDALPVLSAGQEISNFKFQISNKSQTSNFKFPNNFFGDFVICFLELICYLDFVVLEFLALWARWVSAKDCSATVYQKHRSLQTPKEEV